jgi:hypothetical protein
MTAKEETILTKATPASLIRSVQFFIGLAIGLASLWYSSTQWQDISRETLFEVKQLRKDYHRIETQLTELTALAHKNERTNVKYEGKIESLEFRVKTLELTNQNAKKK